MFVLVPRDYQRKIERCLSRSFSNRTTNAGGGYPNTSSAFAKTLRRRMKMTFISPLGTSKPTAAPIGTATVVMSQARPGNRGLLLPEDPATVSVGYTVFVQNNSVTNSILLLFPGDATVPIDSLTPDLIIAPNTSKTLTRGGGFPGSWQSA
jgi:hypothetical protein